MAQLRSLEQPACTWNEGPRTFAIQLAPEVIGRLRAEAWVALKQVPRRGLEIGGILLGHIETTPGTTTFWIEGFDPVESEHRSGPSYMLSEAEQAHLRDAVRNHGERSIGIYRSQTRSEALALDDSDIELFKQAFETREAVFLMLAPVAGKAAVFTKVDGRLKSVHEFSLASAPLTIGSFHNDGHVAARPHRHHPERSQDDRAAKRWAPVERHDAPLVVDQHLMRPEAVVPPPVPRSSISDSSSPEEEPGIQEASAPLPPALNTLDSTQKRGLWILIGAILAVVLAASVGGLFYSSRSMTAAPRTPEYINLTVQRDGSALRLVWDGNSSATRDAAHAILRIDDGGSEIDHDLTPAGIKAGSFTYQPKSSEVTFRLEVFSVDPKGTGMVQAVNLVPAAPAAADPAGPSNVNTAPRRPAPAPLPIGAPAAEHSSQPAYQSSEIDPPETAPPAVETPEPPGSNSAAPAPAENPRQTTAAQNPPAPASTHELSVQILPEAVSVTRVGPWTERIAALRGSGKPANTYAPVPVRQIEPSLDSPEWQHLTRTMFVDVRVYLSETGAITAAQVLRYAGSSNMGLANAALAAARRWAFEPARVEDVPVPSEVILRFRFTP